MPEYRRPWVPGATYFITITTFRRALLFRDDATVDLWRVALRDAAGEKPFDVLAGVVLPDHVHLLIALPAGEDDVSSRIGLAKAAFTKSLRARGRSKRSPTRSRLRHREADVWQRRFYDHLIRDDLDYERHADYLHYNPVHHGLVRCPSDWRWSSFRRWVEAGLYPPDWCCGCEHPSPPDFTQIAGSVGE